MRPAGYLTSCCCIAFLNVVPYLCMCSTNRRRSQPNRESKLNLNRGWNGYECASHRKSGVMYNHRRVQPSQISSSQHRSSGANLKDGKYNISPRQQCKCHVLLGQSENVVSPLRAGSNEFRALRGSSKSHVTPYAHRLWEAQETSISSDAFHVPWLTFL